LFLLLVILTKEASAAEHNEAVNNIYHLLPGFATFACPTSHSGGRNFLACFVVKNNRKGNTKPACRQSGFSPA